jgi:riboflavin biosynthesis pyrimidine reductase
MNEILDALGDFDGATVAVMVSSVNGVIAIDGRVGALTGKADQGVLLGLRERSVAVLVGAATVRAEGYDSLLGKEARARRAALGLPEQPELCVIGRDWESINDTDAVKAGDLRVSLSADLERAAGRTPGPLPDLPVVIAQLRELHGDGLVSIEGGPTVIATGLAQGAITDLVLDLSPSVAVGRHWDPAGETQHPLSLKAHAAAEGFVFLRYRTQP